MGNYVRRETHEALKRELKAAHDTIRRAEYERNLENSKVTYQREQLARLATELQKHEEAAQLHDRVVKALEACQRIIAEREPIIIAMARKGAGL